MAAVTEKSKEEAREAINEYYRNMDPLAVLEEMEVVFDDGVVTRYAQKNRDKSYGYPVEYGDYELNPYGKNVLSVEEHFTSPSPVRCLVFVYGRDEDFELQFNEYRRNPKIPVYGISLIDQKPGGFVRYIFINEDGTGNTTFMVHYNIDHADLGVHLPRIDMELLDETIARASIQNGWLVTDLMNAYDKNGDLRVCGFTGPTIDFPQFTNMKFHNGVFYIQSEHNYYYYSDRYDAYNLMGKRLHSYVAPPGHGFHHDITWDNDGYVYILGSAHTDGEEAVFRESYVYKYDPQGNLLSIVDYTDLYRGTSTLYDSFPYDVHFNTITYVEEIDQLIINSRNSSSYFGVDKRTLNPSWAVQNPAQPSPVLPELFNLTVVNPEEFVHVNGAHTTYITYLKKYDAYRQGDGRFVLAILDNVACKDPQGNAIERPQEDPNYDFDIGYDWDTAIQVVAIDLNRRTIEQLDRLTLPGERSRVTSNVFDVDRWFAAGDLKYFQMFHGVPGNFFVIDTDGKLGVRARHVAANNEWSYRARIWTYKEMNQVAFTGLDYLPI